MRRCSLAIAVVLVAITIGPLYTASFIITPRSGQPGSTAIASLSAIQVALDLDRPFVPFFSTKFCYYCQAENRYGQKWNKNMEIS